ncbi:alpha-ketoglutarate-dependent dioxygenase AlkB family protein [Neptunicella sp. SCSIO 80796]|uniref:alpha-ketoglutarate-dependent dioxygenase AlkB family protein n=1 Tax=Neptunicella plasticusilytica TaxID=3117012 RepID=UPI003A4D4014
MDQYHLAFEQDSEICLPQASIQYYQQFIPVEQADDLLALLLKQLNWRQDHIKMYGVEHKIPRLQAWYGDPDSEYQYSGLQMTPQPWTDTLQHIRQLCEQQTQHKFNSVLCNLYRNGQDSVGMHADDEAELGPQPIIASVSLGQARALMFKHKTTRQSHKLLLQHGSLLVMKGLTQQHWLHGINKSPSVTKPRVNLTFRQIKKGYN